MKHAPLGSSTCHIWKNCPGAGHLMAVAPNCETEPMKRGTAMHKAAEQILKGQQVTEELAADEMEIVQTYCNQVLDMARGCALMIEDTLEIAQNICFGTADAVIYDYKNHMVTIVDFKTGKTKVKVDKNDQLIMLAVAYVTNNKPFFDDIRACIIQPKVYAEPQFYEITREELGTEGININTAIECFLETPSRTVVGKWCSKCKARGFCPTKNGTVTTAPQAEVSW